MIICSRSGRPGGGQTRNDNNVILPLSVRRRVDKQGVTQVTHREKGRRGRVSERWNLAKILLMGDLYGLNKGLNSEEAVSLSIEH